ncbi:MAG TPA: PP0621 family protein [Burkholderiaceae bacterium]|jgi:uncharacterized protein|nr:PP0621 family protein [Burkholderiaceae bacterium]
MKLLLWVAIGFAVVWLLRNKKTRSDMAEPDATPRHPAGPDHVRIESMTRCIQCGVHVPASEAVRNASGETFCSEEHRQKHFSS